MADRDMFAMAAMQGLLASGQTLNGLTYAEHNPTEVARDAYAIADAMMARRTPPPDDSIPFDSPEKP